MKMLEGIFGDRCGRTAEICYRCLDARKIACGKAAAAQQNIRYELGRRKNYEFPTPPFQKANCASIELILEAIEMHVDFDFGLESGRGKD